MSSIKATQASWEKFLPDVLDMLKQLDVPFIKQ